MPGDPLQIYQQQTGDYLHNLLQIKFTEDADLNAQHYKYQEISKDLMVEGAEYIEHSRDGFLVCASGKLALFNDDRSAIPDISPDNAVAILLEYLPDGEYAWMFDEWENDIKDATGDPNASYYPSGELLWALTDYDNLQWLIPESKYKLAYRFEVLSVHPFSHRAYFVDGSTGTVFREMDLVQRGSATTLLYGPQTIDTRWKGGFTQAHILHADHSTRDIHTKYHSSWPFKRRSEVKDNDDIWGTSEQKATTAHWVVQMAWDYFDLQLQWRSPAGNGAGSQKGHFIQVSADVDNYHDAHARPNKWGDLIEFGYKGGNPPHGYTAVLDLAGHEYTHTINNNTAKLVNERETGAVHESLCDIFGFMVEHFSQPQSFDYLIGEDTGFLYSSLETPKNTDQPDTYLGTNYIPTDVATCPNPSHANDNCRIHTNVGVGNYWFYLLGHGGAGVNDNGDPYNVQGIGFENAAYIAHRAFTGMLTSGSKYTDMRASTLAVASLKYGYCSNEHIQTQLAWDAVGVPSTPASDCLHIGLENLNNEVGVFPNPSNGNVTVKFAGKDLRHLSLHNVQGALIVDFGDSEEKERKLALDNLMPGLYILQVIDDGGNTSKVKLILL